MPWCGFPRYRAGGDAAAVVAELEAALAAMGLDFPTRLYRLANDGVSVARGPEEKQAFARRRAAHAIAAFGPSSQRAADEVAALQSLLSPAK